jgi:hypothetical protein
MNRPTKRPGATSRLGAIPRNGAASAAIWTANGSVFPQPHSYLTPSRLHQIGRAMSEADWRLLDFIHQSRFATGEQLIRAFWQTGDATSNAARRGRRALKRLTDWRVLQTLPRSVSGMRGSAGLVYYPGRAGVRLLGARGVTGPRLEVPGTLHLAHTLATTELAVRLSEAARGGTLELIEVQQEPACWRRYPAFFAAERVLRPDLFIRLGAGKSEDRWMIEVDLGSESARTIARKAALYGEHYRAGTEQRQSGVYPRVAWLVPDETRAEQVRSVLGRQPSEARRLFSVSVFDQGVAFLAAEARS